MSRISRVLLLAVLFLLVLTSSGQAYWGDVHYHLTYYLCRITGYTPEQAYRVAAADLSLDWCSATEPAQSEEPTEKNQAPRWKYHAFRKAFGAGHEVTGHGAHEEGDDTALLAQRQRLYRAGVSAKNPGVFLHFFQDELPHMSYGSVWGHWPLDEEKLGLAEAADLPIGGSVDWLSFHKRDYVVILTQESANSLYRFLKEVSPHQARVRGREPSKAEIEAIVDALREINPAPSPLTRDELEQYGIYYLASKTGLPALGVDDENLAKFKKHLEGPDQEASHRAVLAAMRGAGMVELARPGGGLPPYFPARSRFRFDTNARVVKSGGTGMDEYVIAGSLVVKVEKEIKSEGKPVDVVLKAPPTRTGEKEVELVRKEGIRPGGEAEFEDLPVGELIVIAEREGKVIARREQVRLLKRENRTSIGLPTWRLNPGYPKVIWPEDMGNWRLAEDHPVFKPEAPGPAASGFAGMQKSLPPGGKVTFRCTSDDGLSAEIVLTESKVNAVITHQLGEQRCVTTYEFKVLGRPPEEMLAGHEFEIKVTGKAKREGEPHYTTPQSAGAGIRDALSEEGKIEGFTVGIHPMNDQWTPTGAVTRKFVAGNGEMDWALVNVEFRPLPDVELLVAYSFRLER